jgi:hypothetical protein
MHVPRCPFAPHHTPALQVHVVDASSPAALQQRATVRAVLAELGVSPTAQQQRVLEVWNKADVALELAAHVKHLFAPEVQTEWGALARSDTAGGEEAGGGVARGGAGEPSKARLQLAVRMWLAVQRASDRRVRRDWRSAAGAAMDAAQRAVGAGGHTRAHISREAGASCTRAADEDRSGLEDKLLDDSCTGMEPSFPGSVALAASLAEDVSRDADNSTVVVAATQGWGLARLRGHIQQRLVQAALDSGGAQARERPRSPGRTSNAEHTERKPEAVWEGERLRTQDARTGG